MICLSCIHSTQQRHSGVAFSAKALAKREEGEGATGCAAAPYALEPLYSHRPRHWAGAAVGLRLCPLNNRNRQERVRRACPFVQGHKWRKNISQPAGGRQCLLSSSTPRQTAPLKRTLQGASFTMFGLRGLQRTGCHMTLRFASGYTTSPTFATHQYPTGVAPPLSGHQRSATQPYFGS